MVLLLGYLALHLLGAAIASLFLLLLAPAAVIAPALGDGGRAVFRRWGTWLLGAVCSKLIFSFLLGVVLLMQRTLMELTVFGWWAQWLLVSAMWWGAFLKRHHVLGFVHGQHRSGHASGSLLRHAQRVRGKLQNPPALVPGANGSKASCARRRRASEQRRKRAQAGLERAKGIADGQVRRTLEREHGEAHALVQAAPETEARISAKQAQLEQVQARAGRRAGKGSRSAERARSGAERSQGRLVAGARTRGGAVRRRGGAHSSSGRGAAGAHGSSAGRDRGRAGLAHRGAADGGGRRTGRAHDGRCRTRARGPRSARASSTPRRRCRPAER